MLGAETVPLRCIKDCLTDGQNLAINMHDRDKSLVGKGLNPKANTMSKLYFMNSKATDKQIELYKESELTLIGTKIMQEKLFNEYVKNRFKFLSIIILTVTYEINYSFFLQGVLRYMSKRSR